MIVERNNYGQKVARIFCDNPECDHDDVTREVSSFDDDGKLVAELDCPVCGGSMVLEK